MGFFLPSSLSFFSLLLPLSTAGDDLELLILLPPPLKYRDYTRATRVVQCQKLNPAQGKSPLLRSFVPRP